MELYPLSKPQQAIWNMEQYFGGSVANVTGSAFFKEPIDVETLQAALHKTVEQCNSLRIRIKIQGGVPMQYVTAFEPHRIETARFETKGDYEKWVENLARTPFDINHDLYKIFIVTIEGQIGYVLHLHHLTADAWTLSLFGNNTMKNLKGEPVRSNSYFDYLASEREYEASARYLKDREHFMSCFEKCGEPVYFSDKQAKSAASDRLSLAIDTDNTKKIQTFCKDNGISPYSLFMNAMATYIYRIKGAEDMYIGTTVLNRTGKREKETAGIFVNTVPVLFHIDQNKSALENIHENASGVWGILRHQKYQYGSLLKDIRDKYGFTDRLYDIMLNYQNASLADANTEACWHFCGSQGESLNVHINDRQNEGVLHLDYDYQTELFSERDIERLHGHLMNLIFDLMENPEQKPQELKLLSDCEYKQVVLDFNDTAVDFPKDKCIHELFEEQAAKTPEAVAVIACDKTLSYRELNEQANKFANALIKKGVVSDSIIAILLPRESYLIAAMFGILKSGGAYLPLDPNYPTDRINFLLKDSKATAIITTREFMQKISGEVLLIKDILSNENINNPNLEIDKNSLFCALHTSGSTGTPKMSGLTHGNLCSYMITAKPMFNGVETSLSTTTVSFDIFVQETLLALACGIKVVFFNEQEIGNQILFEQKIEEYKNCFIFQTPTKLQNYAKNSISKKFLQHIHSLVVGGEVFTRDLYDLIQKHDGALNIYGPTETTVCVATLKVTNQDNITIGKPIANTQIYILDKHMNPLPIGAAGELCIAGMGVGKGYLNRPELTAEKLIGNPFGSGKMYKTGDLAKWREDGNIEYIGRMDNQVKIRGLRIELGEIETAIGGCGGVKQVAVTVKTDESGRQYICAYYIGSDVDTKAVKAALSKKLPQYMLPHFFIEMERFPTTPSGKTDRKAFPLPDFANNKTDAEYVTPATELEKKIAAIMEKVLGVKKVGVNDNFFDMGGDSLRAIEFVTLAQSEGVHIALQSVFDTPSVALLAKHIPGEKRQTVKYIPTDFADFDGLLLKNKIASGATARKQPLGDVLITGATGWLGSHILDEFLSNESGIAYCLVRGTALSESKEKLNKALEYYFGDKYENCGRIAVICGDIAEKVNLGKPIDTIIHSAANVKHYGTYESFYETNVIGTKNMVDLAREKGAKLIHISTVSVSGNSGEQTDLPPTNYDETKLFIGQSLENVYSRSKFESEIEVLQARLSGLKAAIVRVGNLTNRYSDLKFQRNYRENGTLTRLKAFLDLGCFPKEFEDFELNFSPVCSTAKAIVSLSQHYDDNYSIFHAYNDSIKFNAFAKALKGLGAKIETVSVETFINAVQNAGDNPETEHIHKAFVDDISSDGELLLKNSISVNNDFTTSYLAQIGFEWPMIDDAYLTKYIEHFRNIGYWGGGGKR